MSRIAWNQHEIRREYAEDSLESGIHNVSASVNFNEEVYCQQNNRKEVH